MGRGLGSLRTRQPKAVGPDSRAPRPSSRATSSAPRPGGLHPSPLVQRRTAVPALSLEGVEGWVWGRGRVWGRTRRRGRLCGRAQFGSPGLSLSLLLPPPAPGGARHGGAGARQARYGDVETGEASCGEVVMGALGAGRTGGARGGDTQGLAGQGEEEGVPGETWGPWMGRGGG